MLLLLSLDVSLELGGMELEPLGDVVVVALPLGVVTVVELVSDELELVGGVVLLVLGGGEAGVVVVVLVVLVVPALLRSQPVAATVARARTATTGMSLFMTSPVFVVRRLDESLNGSDSERGVRWYGGWPARARASLRVSAQPPRAEIGAGR